MRLRHKLSSGNVFFADDSPHVSSYLLVCLLCLFVLPPCSQHRGRSPKVREHVVALMFSGQLSFALQGEGQRDSNAAQRWVSLMPTWLDAHAARGAVIFLLLSWTSAVSSATTAVLSVVFKQRGTAVCQILPDDVVIIWCSWWWMC